MEFRFVSGVMWWTQVSYPVTILSRKAGSSWQRSRLFKDTPIR
jgi:hypothetical protein